MEAAVVGGGVTDEAFVGGWWSRGAPRTVCMDSKAQSRWLRMWSDDDRECGCRWWGVSLVGGVGVIGGGSWLVEALLKTHLQVLIGSEIKGPKDVVKLLMHVFI